MKIKIVRESTPPLLADEVEFHPEETSLEGVVKLYAQDRDLDERSEHTIVVVPLDEAAILREGWRTPGIQFVPHRKFRVTPFRVTPEMTVEWIVSECALSDLED